MIPTHVRPATPSDARYPGHPPATAPGEKTLFLRQFLRKGVQVSSLVPSSRTMARAAARYVNPNRVQTILELGAGTGPITRELMGLKHPHSRVIAIELDPEFVPLLRQNCPGAEVVEADVRRLSEVLVEHNVESLDVVINALPTPSLPVATNTAVLETLERFAPRANVTQVTIMPLVFQHLYKRIWQHVEFELVLKNVPPGGVYHMKDLKPDWRDKVMGKP